MGRMKNKRRREREIKQFRKLNEANKYISREEKKEIQNILPVDLSIFPRIGDKDPSSDTIHLAIEYKQFPDKTVEQSKYNPKNIKRPVKKLEWFPSLKNYLIMEFDRNTTDLESLNSLYQDIDIISADEFIPPVPLHDGHWGTPHFPTPEDAFYADDGRWVDQTNSGDAIWKAAYSQIMLKSWHRHEYALSILGYGNPYYTSNPRILLTDTRVETDFPDLKGKVDFAFDPDPHYGYSNNWTNTRCHGTAVASLITARTDDMNSTAEWMDPNGGVICADDGMVYDTFQDCENAGCSECAGNLSEYDTGGGMAGTCPNCSIIAASYYGEDPENGGPWDGIINGVEYALDNNIKVINASWGQWGNPYTTTNRMRQDAINDAWCGKDSTWVYESQCEGFGYIENGEFQGVITGTEDWCDNPPALFDNGSNGWSPPYDGTLTAVIMHMYFNEDLWPQSQGQYFDIFDPDQEPVMKCSHPGARGAFSSDPDDEFSYLIPPWSFQTVPGFDWGPNWWPYEWGYQGQGVPVEDTWRWVSPDRACQLGATLPNENRRPAGCCLHPNGNCSRPGEDGVIVVAAAGNMHYDQNPNDSYDINGFFIRRGRESAFHYPSGQDHVISVCDSNINNRFSYDSSCPYPTTASPTSGWYSEWDNVSASGPCRAIDVSAPGWQVMIAQPDPPNSVESCTGLPYAGELFHFYQCQHANNSNDYYGISGKVPNVIIQENNCCFEEYGGNNCYYAIGAGTSLSAPFISGLLGLCLSQDKNLRVDELRDIIHSSNTAPTWTNIPIEDDCDGPGNPYPCCTGAQQGCYDLIPSSADSENGGWDPVPKPQSFDVWDALLYLHETFLYWDPPDDPPPEEEQPGGGGNFPPGWKSLEEMP